MSTATLNEAVGFTNEQLPAEKYHGDHSAISSGMLEDFRESRRLYEGRYITKTIPPREQSPAMQLGSWIHTRLLEPEKYFATLADPLPELAPDGKKWLKRKGSDHERWWADELAAREGMIAIDQEKRDRIEAIAASIMSKEWAWHLKAKGESEYSIFWTDRETGLPCKCRVDWFAPTTKHLDLKTTEQPWPSAFVRTAVKLGYHRKRAHYLDGIRAFTGEKNPPLLHIAAGTVPPYSAGAYNLGDFDSRMNAPLGAMERRASLNALAACCDSGDFSDPWERQIMDLEFPAYAFTQSAYQL